MTKLKLLARRLLKPKIIKEHGVLLDISSSGVSPQLRDFLYQGQYEKQEMFILKETLDDHDTLLDIGAGIGLTSIWAAKRLRSVQRVYAVEASPRIIESIAVNAALNKVDIVIKWGAVTVNPGDADFYMTPHFWSSSLLPKEGAQPIKVPSISLDDLIKEHRPTYIMMDVEGAEYMILQNSDLSTIQKLCVEIHPHYIGLEKTIELIGYLSDIGFNAEKHLCSENGFFFHRS